ncbi:tripartite tricarboxylate transporter substrate binding protein [Bosea sp. 117]|uniref:Bug family tripartite tricarboxylate transporter substrate binding protein n=1 Tax=Bosea sp. 117 TaxID=1125973 RepID=UPI000494B63A|nr:tripartite tricarboxylate transporter substrate binding protein [Bosea sp. 117]
MPSKIALGFVASLALLCAGSASAQTNKYDYPVTTVTLTTHSKPGSGSDLFLRKLSKALSKEMGINFVVDYWAGGSGAKAMAQLAKAKPDGSVFYATTPTHVTTSLLSAPPVTYKDIDYAVNVFFDPEIIYALSNSPFSTMKDAVAWSKANPGKARWGGSTAGSLERQILERINSASDAKATVIPQDDGAALLINVLGGSVDLGVGELQELNSYIEAGKVKVLGVYYPDRLAALPNATTIQEQGLDKDVIRKFRGLAAPKGVPPATIAKLEKAVQAILADPEFKKEYEADALVAGYMSQADYRAFMANFVKEQEGFLKQFGVTQN